MGIIEGRMAHTHTHTQSMCKGPVAGETGVLECHQGGSGGWNRGEEEVEVKGGLHHTGLLSGFGLQPH